MCVYIVWCFCYQDFFFLVGFQQFDYDVYKCASLVLSCFSFDFFESVYLSFTKFGGSFCYFSKYIFWPILFSLWVSKDCMILFDTSLILYSFFPQYLFSFFLIGMFVLVSLHFSLTFFPISFPNYCSAHPVTFFILGIIIFSSEVSYLIILEFSSFKILVH